MSRLGIIIASLAVTTAVAAVAGGLWMAGRPSPEVAACRASAELVAKLKPHAKGEVAAVQIAMTPRPLPDLAFRDADGQPRRLSDFRGRTVLVNLWATWCAPCRKEMPALDALQATLGGKDFEVVAINIDTRNLERPRNWLGEAGISRLAYYADPEAKVFQDLKRVGRAVGMPTTLLVGADGCELGVLHGPAEWASEEAKGLIRTAMGP